jgi:hypothetical protein
MSTVTHWLHIEYLGGDKWVLDIWSAVTAAVKRGVATEPMPEIRELGLHLSTRLTMLPRVYRRITEGSENIWSAISTPKPKYVSTPSHQGYAFKLKDDLKFSFLLDLDSLLFELNSVCELMVRFFELSYSCAGQRLSAKSASLEVKRVLKAARKDTQWFRNLDTHRNFFLHNGAPYFAVDLTNSAVHDLLIMKKNLHVFDDESKFMRLTTIAAMVQGFEESREAIAQHLIDLFKSL